MQFCDRLKALRIEKKLSQTELASQFGKSESAVRMWETDRSKPDCDTLLKLAEYFDVSTDYLLGKCKFKNDSERDSHNRMLDGINDTFDDMPVSVKKRFSSIFYELLKGYEFSECDDELAELYLDLLLSLSIGASVSVGIISSMFGFHKEKDGKLLSEDVLEIFLYEFSASLDFITQKTREFEQKAKPIALSLFSPDITFKANNNDNLTVLKRLEKFEQNMVSEQHGLS